MSQYNEVDVHEEFKMLNEDENELYKQKNKDYAGRGDPFGNFRRIANILSNYPKLKVAHPLTVVMTGILKQLDCILDALATNRELEVESVQERFRDISVYCKIAEIMLMSIDGLFPVEDEDKHTYETEETEGTKEAEETEDDEGEEEGDEGSDEPEDGEDEETEDDEEEVPRVPRRKLKRTKKSRYDDELIPLPSTKKRRHR